MDKRDILDMTLAEVVALLHERGEYILADELERVYREAEERLKVPFEPRKKTT
jgi:hypothetical protein